MQLINFGLIVELSNLKLQLQEDDDRDAELYQLVQFAREVRERTSNLESIRKGVNR